MHADGCNAAAIVGCRIIDSPRERLIAILTNAFVPCNGRFPALIAVIGMFFTNSAFASGALAGAVMLTALLIVSEITNKVTAKHKVAAEQIS